MQWQEWHLTYAVVPQLSGKCRGISQCLESVQKCRGISQCLESVQKCRGISQCLESVQKCRGILQCLHEFTVSWECSTGLLLKLCDVSSGVAPELVKQENLLHSIAAALHLSTGPITGQPATPAQLQRNPAVSVDVEQPLMQVDCML